MKWSWRIGEVAGIDVYVHATFLLLIGWVFLSYWLEGASLSAVLVGVAFVLALFASVVAHELGHALTARRFGIQTRDIVLLPIGGVARLARRPEEPRREFWVALAGPLTSLALAAGLFLILLATGRLGLSSGLSLAGGSFLQRLMVANASLALFNLLPLSRWKVVGCSRLASRSAWATTERPRWRRRLAWRWPSSSDSSGSSPTPGSSSPPVSVPPVSTRTASGFAVSACLR